MKRIRSAQQVARASVAGLLLVALAAPAAAVDLKTGDGAWTFSIDGNVNVDYIFSNCQSVSSSVNVGGGLTCVGSASGSNVSNIGNGLLPAAFTFGVSTTQEGLDLSAHLGLYPGIATNNSGSPNLQPNNNGGTNTALGSTGLDIRQVYLTFGNKDMGTFTLGRNIGLFGADVILNDMTLPGVGAPGSAASAAPANTTLGGIGFGYIYTDWLAQIDYTTPDLSGFSLTVGVYDPLNSLSDTGTVEAKKAPGFHAKLAYTLPIADGTKLYLSAAFISQQQYYEAPAGSGGATGTGPVPYNYTGDGVDIFVKLDVQDLELIGYYYHATGLGTTALFNLGDFGLGQTRSSDGYFAQATYKIDRLKIGVNYGDSKLDTANAADALANPLLVADNKKVTVGLYYNLTKNLMLLGEFSNTKSDAQSGGSNSANSFNIGAYLGF
ncbi:MAG TPA: porin [Steroidobacteraceae bacterium]|jgi:predicted porin|nr:porin [Steroidobacteraceae bacterium]